MKFTRILIPAALVFAVGLVGCSPEEEPTEQQTQVVEEQPPVEETASEETAPEETEAAETAPAETEPAEPEETVPPAEADPADQAQALEDYVAAVQAQIPELIESFDGMYSEIMFEGFAPGTVQWTYVYSEAVDLAAANEHFESQVPEFQKFFDEQMLGELQRNGITESPAMTYRYLQPDKSEIWSRTFTSSEEG